MKNMNTDLLNTLMEQSDFEMKHMEMKDEFDFYRLVSSGDRPGLDRRGFSLMDEGLGKLSENKTRNFLYHFIISLSLITRMCIEKGMASETAYTLSDLYIREVDLMTKPEEINELHRTMVYDYTDRMKTLVRTKHYSIHIIDVLAYINDHLSEAISVDDIAAALKLNKSYLCSLFKKETGITVGTYIEDRKDSYARDYLINTNTPFIDIANSLGYKSYSYFIKIFKKRNGITPSAYRKTHLKNYLTA